MPLAYFLCPDGERVRTQDCLRSCRFTEGRCLSPPTLAKIADRRRWTGKPSTTQLLKGTRQAYLEIVHDYAVKPKKQAFMLLGTSHHSMLEGKAKRLSECLPEGQLDEDVSGRFDLITPDELEPFECYHLWDYKSSGSFKVAKALGLVPEKVPDPSGATYKTSGKWGKAGDPKMITVYTAVEGAQDMRDWELQVNKYRIDLEHIGFPISRMTVQATVRDGNTMSAFKRGLQEEIYLIPVRRLPNEEVRAYFELKRTELLWCLGNHHLPSPCTEEETWQGKKCKRVCEVVEFCPEGMEIKQQAEEQDE